MKVKVNYNIINRTHDGYCSGADASECDDNEYEQLGSGNNEVTIDDDDYEKYFDDYGGVGVPILKEFNVQLSHECGSKRGSGYCKGFGIWKRAKSVSVIEHRVQCEYNFCKKHKDHKEFTVAELMEEIKKQEAYLQHLNVLLKRVT
jgi:hypothetical protein